MNLVPASTSDYRRLAERRLPRPLFDYVDGGAYEEITKAANAKDFAALPMQQRVLEDVSLLDTSTELLGESWAMPLALAPVGFAGMMARRAEVFAKQAADQFGVPFCLSTVSICSLEEVAAASSRPFWFQLYMLRDRGAVKDMIARAKQCGVSTLVFTVDLPVVGARYRDTRNGLGGGIGSWGKLRSGLLSWLSRPRWLLDVGIQGKPHVFGNLTEYVANGTTPTDFKAWIDAQFDPSVSWKDIEWLRSIWDGKLLIKGILHPDDALSAANCGADAIIVSNHGGRQLDGVSSSITMLPRIVNTVAGKLDVLMDGGVYSGQSVVKAVALGAKATLIGRPWVYAMAAGGQSSLRKLLNTFKSEMEVSMALTGCCRIEQLNPDILDTRQIQLTP